MSFWDAGTLANRLYGGLGIRLLSLLEAPLALAQPVAAAVRRSEPARADQPAGARSPPNRCSGAGRRLDDEQQIIWGTTIYDPQGQQIIWGDVDTPTTTRSSGARDGRRRSAVSHGQHRSNATLARHRARCSRLSCRCRSPARWSSVRLARRGRRATPHPLEWLLFAALAIATGRFTLNFASVNASISVADTFFITPALLFGPAPATLAIAADSLMLSWRRGHAWRRLAFNTAAPALVAVGQSRRPFFLSRASRRWRRRRAVAPLIAAAAAADARSTSC